MKRIVIVFGGPTWEREGSIISAEQVARGLDRIGIPNYLYEFDQRTIAQTIQKSSFIFNAIHGRFGEDGILSALCETFGVPYNFSPPYAHMIAMDKLRMKSHAQGWGLRVPSTLAGTFDEGRYTGVRPASRDKGKGYVLKPLYGGGSRGVQFIPSDMDPNAAIAAREQQYDPYFIEEFIRGKFITCAVSGVEAVDESLPLLEVRLGAAIYDYNIKHQQSLHQYIVPAELGVSTAREIRRASKMIFISLGCRAFARFDFIVDAASDEIFFLETNTVPGLSRLGNLHAIWAATGRSYEDLLRFLTSDIQANEAMEDK